MMTEGRRFAPVSINPPKLVHFFLKSLVRIVAADDWMNRDTTCRSVRPLLRSRNGEACAVRGSASLQAESTRGVVG
jgi:hypothetical protein